MAYINGSANDITALRSALITACTANGWTLSGEVLHKGTSFVRLQIASGRMTLLGGTGIDGSNVLTGAAPAVVQIGAHPTLGMTFPVTYHIFIHTNPDEVFLVVNYEVDKFQWAAFGKSSVIGLPGTGFWVGASINQSVSTFFAIDLSGQPPSFSYGIPVLFWRSRASSFYGAAWIESFFHHGFDGYSWASGDSSADPSVSAVEGVSPLMARLPNAWNSEGVLLPIQGWRIRPSNKLSLVVDLGHARYTRIDNYEPGQVITLGPDRWMVFPWFRKNTASRDGMANPSGTASAVHSGTLGWAIRYDGP